MYAQRAQTTSSENQAMITTLNVPPRSGRMVSLLRGATETMQSGVLTLSHPDIPGPILGPAAILPTVSPFGLIPFSKLIIFT